MSAFLRKYNTATHIYVPIVKRAVVDFAVGADWTPVAGDVKVSIDGGAVANIGTLPVAIAAGNGAFWDFTIAAGEVLGKKITVTTVDAATKAIEDQCFVIETYGNASAEHPFDLGTALASQTVGTASALTTNNDKTGYALSAAGSAAMTEGYPADGAAGTLPQLLYLMLAFLQEKNIAGTTVTTKKLDGATTAATYTLDSSTAPTTITRAT